eukprot:936051-Rhodomonas_salina.2
MGNPWTFSEAVLVVEFSFCPRASNFQTSAYRLSGIPPAAYGGPVPFKFSGWTSASACAVKSQCRRLGAGVPRACASAAGDSPGAGVSNFPPAGLHWHWQARGRSLRLRVGDS